MRSFPQAFRNKGQFGFFKYIFSTFLLLFLNNFNFCFSDKIVLNSFYNFFFLRILRRISIFYLIRNEFINLNTSARSRSVRTRNPVFPWFSDSFHIPGIHGLITDGEKACNAVNLIIHHVLCLINIINIVITS